MNYLKRMLITLLALTMMLSSIPVSAADSADRDDKADFLNELTILRGDGTGYNFDGQLKRSEAATFIVRMLGEDSEVTAVPEDYIKDTFSDVTASDWFAPYVGYCVEEGIVAGFEDGTFRPNDYVSEKAFLKMLMTAMGYTYNEDFTWAQVYSYAYEINLVSDTAYRTKINDNYSYTRGDVISSLFDTLSATKKGSTEKMIQYFVDAEIIDEADAVELGMLEDPVDTELESIEVFDEKTILLTFNEALQDITEEQIIVYEKDDTDVVLTIDEINADSSNKIFTIVFDEDQEPDLEYGVLLDELLDTYGNESEMLSDTFEGFRPDVIESNFFRISKAEAISNKMVYVYFTHPVNINMTQPSLYTVAEGKDVLSSSSNVNLTASLVGSDDTIVAISLDDDSFDADTEYQITISGTATSQYNVTLNDGDGDYVKFEGVEKEEEKLKMLLANAINDSTVEINFNKEVNEIIAEYVFSYQLKDSDGDAIEITNATLSDDGEVVTLQVNDTLKDDAKYTLVIVNASDVTLTDSIMVTSYTFTSNFNSSTSDVTIKSASSIDNNTVVLTISRALDVETATNASYYDIDGVGNTFSANPIAVYYDPEVNPLKVKLFLEEDDDLAKSKTYEVSMSNRVKDAGGRRQEDKQEDTFTHKSSIDPDVYIKDAVVVGEKAIKLTFSKEIAVAIPNVLNDNYLLKYTVDDTDYTKIPVSANYIDPLTMIVHFDQLDEAIEYEITFESLVNYAGIETDNSTYEYIEEVDWD